VWSFIQSRKQIALVESQYDIKLSFPTLMKDLIFKLEVKYKNSGIDIFDTIGNIIDGYFKQDKKGDFYFYKDTQQIELENTAMGIKQFGILQVLSKNGYLNSNTLLILDEPEVHLHPKWQLEMAKVIVELVKNGVKVLVNSHSPYMIEALERYAEKEEVTADFYLAEDGYIKKENNSNSETLARIFEKLAEPFDVFTEMESQKMENFING
jgi:predicted ATPase